MLQLLYSANFFFPKLDIIIQCSIVNPVMEVLKKFMKDEFDFYLSWNGDITRTPSSSTIMIVLSLKLSEKESENLPIAASTPNTP
jgi:hypothetical protein